MERTEGFLLGGRVRYAQPKTGFRSALEPVLLAAAIPARPGDAVLEGGSGAGAGLLCLAARLPGVTGVGIEQDPVLAALARDNAAHNGFATLCFRTERVEAARGGMAFDHAFANPPYHPAAGTRSTDAGRDTAKHAKGDLLAVWAACLASHLRPRGTLTLILPAARLPECLAALEAAGCGSGTLLPLWPRAGQSAKLSLVQAVRAGRGPFRVLPGLALHAVMGDRYTDEAERVLREGAALPL